MEKSIKKTYGPYERKDDRKHVIHIYTDGSRKTQSYPRYLIEQAIGRELSIDEDIHHVDEDYTNNSLDNLEIIIHGEHQSDHEFDIVYENKWYRFDCPVCGEPAKKRMKDVRGNWSKGSKGPFCSRSCAGKYNT